LVYDEDDKEWHSRKKFNHRIPIGRIYNVSIKNKELYYLRILLSNTPGAKSFESLYEDDEGNICESYQEACIQRCLIELDNELYDVLNEMKEHKSAPQMRNTLYFYVKENAAHRVLENIHLFYEDLCFD
jgi:hypothetical protein